MPNIGKDDHPKLCSLIFVLCLVSLITGDKRKNEGRQEKE